LLRRLGDPDQALFGGRSFDPVEDLDGSLIFLFLMAKRAARKESSPLSPELSQVVEPSRRQEGRTYLLFS